MLFLRTFKVSLCVFKGLENAPFCNDYGILSFMYFHGLCFMFSLCNKLGVLVLAHFV